MRAAVIIVEPPASMMWWASASEVNGCTFKHSSRNHPLHDSIQAFSTGLPGRMQSSGTPRRYAQSSSARD